MHEFGIILGLILGLDFYWGHIVVFPNLLKVYPQSY